MIVSLAGEILGQTRVLIWQVENTKEKLTEIRIGEIQMNVTF